MKADIEVPYGDVTRADAVREVVMMRALRKRETEKNNESAAKDTEIHQLQQELEHEQVRINCHSECKVPYSLKFSKFRGFRRLYLTTKILSREKFSTCICMHALYTWVGVALHRSR